MSGGIRTSVKGHLNAQRRSLTGELNVVHGMNGGVNRNFSAPQAFVDSLDKKKQQDYPLPLPPSEKRIASSSSGPIELKSALKSVNSYETRTRNESQDEDVPSTPRIEGGLKIKRFSFDELKTATWNFHPHNKVGEGGFGGVFKGWIDDISFRDSKPGTGTLIAVKRVNRQGFQGHKEWLAEIHFLGRLRHPNLVRLLGYCSEDDHELLVYELASRGSLDYHLFGRASYLEPLSWIRRMKIALDVAKVVSFIHDDVGTVIHGDIKSSNILLDSAYNAKLSDFGLAEQGLGHVSTTVMGTYGYASPEYVATGHLTVKSDVYGFGVVMLELLSGRQVVDYSRPTEEKNLVDWARHLFASKSGVLKLFDTRLAGQYSVSAARKAAKLASRCLLLDSKSRPNMKEVANALEQLQGSSDNERSGTSQSEPRQSPRSISSSAEARNRWRNWISFWRSRPRSRT